ncbi:RNase H-like domain found in reverse transcriptase [Popillia japonica]|uniref:RNase H-like domain found in reverse transcriptase n=1 Tax=Popillia japonica TaxID=7064 RepID=A0AAW1KLH1_POPJA
MENKERALFKLLKEKLATEPKLKIFNHEYETELHVDASQEGFGGVLLQKDPEDGHLHPTFIRKVLEAFFCKRIPKMVTYILFIFAVEKQMTSKRNISYELEVLAIIEAIKRKNK